MRRRQAVVLVAAGVLLLAAAAPAQAPVQDQGTLVVTQGGQALGEEHFTLHSDAGGTRLDATLDYSVSGKPVRQRAALRLGPRGALKSYEWSEGASASITLKYANGRIDAHYQAAKGTGRDYQFEMPATTSILDENVFSLWEVLAARYDWAKGGAQSFGVFVPHSGDPSHVTLTAAHEPHALPGQATLHAETDQASLNLLLEHGRLLQIEVPAAGVVIRRAQETGR